MASEDLVLFGAGSAGRYALRHLRAQGIEPVCFVDNDEIGKQGMLIESLVVMLPDTAAMMYPDATWVATAISRPAAAEIRAQLKGMGVKTKPLWECLPVCHGLPPANANETVRGLLTDMESVNEWNDQWRFRHIPDYAAQRDPSPISELYFPSFIAQREDEHFVDCGACDGDTIDLFLARWDKWKEIVAFEPDPKNHDALTDKFIGIPNINAEWAAVSDHAGMVEFEAAGDYSSHIVDKIAGATISVRCVKLDDALAVAPTYIKMDIEGSELEAIWGARKIIKEHSPVLAICAYHTSDHLWQLPLLIHAIQPEYKLYFRRYAEGAYEIVWYAVPPERVK